MDDKKSKTSSSIWWVYIIRCADSSFYTGITKDVIERVAQHNQGHGAKYTRGRGPVELLYKEHVGEHGDALRREYVIKQMSKSEKTRMIEAHQQKLLGSAE